MKDSIRVFKSGFLIVFLFLYTGTSYADPIGSNGWNLNSPLQVQSNSDLVCKVQVLSIQRQEAVKNPSTWASDVYRMIATTKVLSVIKGECPNTIEIEFEYPLGSSNMGISILRLYTGFSEKEICIVFLKQEENKYKLNRINSKLRVVPEIVEYNLGNTPNMKLVAEFLAGCDSNDDLIKLQAVEELGFQSKKMIEDLGTSSSNKETFDKITFALNKVKEALRKTQESQDLVIKNISYIASFQADDSPGIEGPLALLRMNPSEFDPNDSLKKYGIKEFCVSNLQLRLLETMDSTTRRGVYDFNDRTIIRRENGIPEIYRGLRNFDYAEFYKQALDCEAVKNNEQMRIAIANVLWIRFERRSVPVMMRLLDDTNAYIRHETVDALRKCINSDFSNSWESADYQDNEKEYIKYWKDWWEKNKGDFE
jgi:hypothetical protein